MIASRRRSHPSLTPLLAIGAACMGACSAPEPPATPAREAPAQEAELPSDPTATTTPTPVAGEATTPADAAPATTGRPPPQPAPPPSAPEPMMPAPPAQAGNAQPVALTVTMLSRGKGVPDATRAAYKDIRALLEDQRSGYAVTGLRSQHIGLEGETRLCVEFANAQDARAALDAIRKRVANVDLLDVSDAPCPSPKDSTP